MSLLEIARQIGIQLKRHHLKLVTAESCTGGLLAGAITDVPGSSAWFERGFVTYSNEAKQELLDVPRETLEHYGAVSEQTARAMANGALAHSRGQIALAVTGIAGPDGATGDKPVGMVCFAWALRGGSTTTQTQYFDGDRFRVRYLAVVHALKNLPDIS